MIDHCEDGGAKSLILHHQVASKVVSKCLSQEMDLVETRMAIDRLDRMFVTECARRRSCLDEELLKLSQEEFARMRQEMFQIARAGLAQGRAKLDQVLIRSVFRLLSSLSGEQGLPEGGNFLDDFSFCFKAWRNDRIIQREGMRIAANMACSEKNRLALAENSTIFIHAADSLANSAITDDRFTVESNLALISNMAFCALPQEQATIVAVVGNTLEITKRFKECRSVAIRAMHAITNLLQITPDRTLSVEKLVLFLAEMMTEFPGNLQLQICGLKAIVQLGKHVCNDKDLQFLRSLSPLVKKAGWRFDVDEETSIWSQRAQETFNRRDFHGEVPH